MKVMILAAGLGTRLRPLTAHCPKPLLPLLFRPMLDHILDRLRLFGVQEVVINMHHQAAQLRQWLGDGRQWDLRLHLSHEREILGTAGAMKRVESLLRGAPFLVINADVLMDIDLPAIWRWHCERDAVVTMVVRPDPSARQYGAVVVDAGDRVRCISGRPEPTAPTVGQEMMFTGVQVVSPAVLDRIPPARFVSTTTDIYPALIAQNEAVYGYRYTGYWMDVGVPERYRQAHWDILDGFLGDQWSQLVPPGTRVVRDTDVPQSEAQATAIVPPVVLASDVEIASGARVGPYAVIGAGCRLEADAVVQESVLWEDVHIEARAQVSRCILGTGVRIRAASVLCDTTRSA